MLSASSASRTSWAAASSSRAVGRALAADLDTSEASVSGWLAGQHEPSGEPRRRLMALGLIDAPEATITDQVAAYVRRCPGRTPARIALDTGIAVTSVRASLRNLRRQGRVKPVEQTSEAWPA